MATLMHEGGADICFIQAILGHADLKTTQIYTQVAIRALKQIHAATHPAAMLDKTEAPALRTKPTQHEEAHVLFAVLDAEAEEDNENQ